MPEILEIDGVDLRGQGFGAAMRMGRYAMPQRRGSNLVVAGSSGALFVKNRPFEEGSGSLQCWAIGATQDANGNLSIPATRALQRVQLEANLAKLQRIFTRGHRLSTMRAGQPDGTVRRALVEWSEWSEPEIQAGNTRAEFTMTYRIPGVWWEDETVTTQSATANSTLPKTLNLTAFTGMTGVIEDAVLTVAGPILNPRITDAETGAYVEYIGTVANGSSWVVDVANATSMVGAASAIMNTRHAGYYKLFVVPNVYLAADAARLVLSGSNGGAATNLTVAARRKWATG